MKDCIEMKGGRGDEMDFTLLMLAGSATLCNEFNEIKGFDG